MMDCETYFKTHDQLVCHNVGRSMLPLLRENRDLFILKKKTGQRCKKYDIALYRSREGNYILHRIIEVRERDYVFRGDNCIGKEWDITDDMILAVMTGFVRSGREYRVDSFEFWLYTRIICWSYPLRAALKKGRRYLSRRLNTAASEKREGKAGKRE